MATTSEIAKRCFAAGSAHDLDTADADVEQARVSIRKLGALDPSAVWAAHANPVTGDVAGQLPRASAAPL